MKKHAVLFLLTSVYFQGQLFANTLEIEREISNARVEVVKRARPAVVYIETKQKDDQMKGFMIDPFEGFFGRREHPKRNASSSGSGFLVSEDGYIITNNHVVEGAQEITVEITAKDGSEKQYSGTLVGFDPRTDLAILKIEEKGLPFLHFADSEQVQEGQSTIAVGHPYRLRHSITAGIISAKHRTNIELTDRVDYMQTDAALNPGCSGGPLLDLDGSVIGVNTAIREKSNGLGFAIPSNIVKMVFEHVKATGSVDRGFLGVSLQDLDEDLVEAFSYQKGTKGALITSVEKDSAGEVCGLLAGDLVVNFNQTKIKSAKELHIAIGKVSAGEKASLDILRGGKILALTAKLGSQIASVQNSNVLQRLGAIVEEQKEEKGGTSKVVIKQIVPGTLAYQAGWKPGSTIVQINGEKISSIKDLARALEKNTKEKKLAALLEIHGQSFFTTITTP